MIRLAEGVGEDIAAGRIRLEGMTPLEATVKRLVQRETLKVRAKDEPLMLEDQEFLDAIHEGRDPAARTVHPDSIQGQVSVSPRRIDDRVGWPVHHHHTRSHEPGQLGGPRVVSHEEIRLPGQPCQPR